MKSTRSLPFFYCLHLQGSFTCWSILAVCSYLEGWFSEWTRRTMWLHSRLTMRLPYKLPPFWGFWRSMAYRQPFMKKQADSPEPVVYE